MSAQDYKILTIIHANSDWSVRFRADWIWDDDITGKLKDLSKKKRKRLTGTHVQDDYPVVCWALVEWKDGQLSVEPMTNDDDGISIVSHLEGYAGIFKRGLPDGGGNVVHVRCKCFDCRSLKNRSQSHNKAEK